MVFFCLILLLLLCGCTQKNGPLFENQEELKIIVASDLHYYPKSYYENYPSYQQLFFNGDGQMVHVSNQIINNFVSEIILQEPNLVLLSGDLTYNGEKLGHQELAKVLQSLRDHDIEVAVINGNHDVNNRIAGSFDETGYHVVDSVTADEFKEIYHDFGYANATSLDSDSLSYRLNLNEHYDLLMIDSCDMDRYRLESGISESTMSWMEEQLKDITTNNKEALVVMHHNLGIHCELLYKGYVLENHEEVVNLFNEYHVPLVFSGHTHVQHSMDVNGTYEITSGALIVAPVQYGVLSLSPEKIDYHTQEVESVEGDDDFFLAASYSRFLSQLASTLDETTAQQAAVYLANINKDYFAGCISETAETYKNDPMYTYLISQKEEFEFLVQYMELMLNETQNHQSYSR